MSKSQGINCLDNIKRTPLPSQEALRSLFDYDNESGCLSYRLRDNPRFNKAWAGKIAGHMTNRGYVQIYLDGRKIWAHRAIWKMFHGYDPREIDHINGNKSDNRLSNLREVDRTQNNINIKRRTKNSSGVTGVHWSKVASKWVAQIIVDKKTKYLGQFPTKLEAIAARRGAERALGYHDF
ncbi:MAG: HNH endonuclease [Sphingobium sp.]|uniref:HNH endonuclease n=1 Tax=Sphingobium sp. TaxID=1912891 RepID=UPI0017AE89A2|nr:HNH endonuclease [Sphingobium sp.]MBA4754598.1 HNH endonuclease [Sphingobium sp.]